MNIIIVAVDGLRPAHLGCYGYERNTSPFIDSLAKKGVLFEKAFANSSWTKPNIASMITSLNASTHKVHTIEDKIMIGVETLPEILKEHGYKTGLFSGLRHPREVYGFRGFEKRRIFEEYPVQLRTADKINGEMLSWIKSTRKSNFFIYVHYVDTHLPFNPPKPFNTAFLKEPYTHKDPIGTSVSAEELEKVIPLYDSEILYFDSEFRKFVEALEKMRLLENTLIVITSDHGFPFMEHGQFGLLKFLYEENIRVPLIMYCKCIKKRGRIRQQASMIDLMPTILDRTSLKFVGRMEGRSLAPLMDGKKLPEKPIFLEAVENSHEPYCSGRLFQGIRTSRWKYIRTKQFFRLQPRPKMFTHLSYWENNLLHLAKGALRCVLWGFRATHEELYDIKKDPGEKKNLASEKAGITAKMGKMLETHTLPELYQKLEY